MHRLRTTRLKRPILWIAVLALLLSAISSQLRVTTCIGDSCPLKDAVVATECTPPEATEHACCAHCDERAPSPSEEQPLSDPRGGDLPDCCVTVDFNIELAPANTPVELPMLLALALPPTPQSFAPMPVREVQRLRPFDRGPPRIDRSTALRVCTVLLI